MQDDDWIRTIVIGTVLTFASFLVIPVFLVYGYLLRVLDRGSRGVAEPPVFDEWEDLLVNGVKMFAVVFLYQLVPMVVLLLVAFIGIIGLGDAGAVGIIIGLLVLGVYTLAVYFLPAALTNMAREGTFSAAFDFDTIRAGAFSGEYLVGLVVAVAVGVVGGIVAGLFSLLIVGLFLFFYVQVVTFYIAGSGFGRGIEATTR